MRPRLLRHPLGGGLDPAAAFGSLYAGHSDVFWLDSGPGGTSYLGAGRPVALERPVLEGLRRELGDVELEVDSEDDDAPAFRLGLVGWLGYELRGETTGVEPTRPSRYPAAAFLRVERALAIAPDGTAELLAIGTGWHGELAAWRDDVIRSLAEPPAVPPAIPAASGVRWHDDDERYLANVRACQEAIRAGEAYQLCLTTEAEVDGVYDPLAVYLAVRATSGTHHGALLRIGGVSLLSATPERFLDIAPDGLVRTRPIKGTRPRSSDPDEDARLREELEASEKERAENLMIVDLMRNDLSRVCELGSVAVTGLLQVESYAHVHQLVSTVEGRLGDGLTAVDAVAACFPAGSMTGAPKLRATELLDELEQRSRGLYAGAFGYFGFDGRADLAMTIRSIVIDEHGATIGAGGGITALSVPEEELVEARVKAAALLAVLGAGEPGPTGPGLPGLPERAGLGGIGYSGTSPLAVNGAP